MHPYITVAFIWITLQYWRLNAWMNQYPYIRRLLVTVKHHIRWIGQWFRFVYNGCRSIISSKRPPNVVIAICGKKGSGKDTSARIIRRYMWMQYTHLYRSRAFAKPLKDVVKVLTQCSDDKLHTHEGKESTFPNAFSAEPETYRDILKSVGKATRRFLANWMHQTWRHETSTMNYFQLPNCWVITDLRLNDELKWLRTEVAKDARVFVVKIECVNEPDKGLKDSDITEVSVDSFSTQDIDFTIYNHTWTDQQDRLQKDCERMCDEIMYQIVK